MKRILAIFLSISLLLLMIPLNGVLAVSETGIFEASGIGGETGSSVTVQISVKSNPGVTTMQVLVGYDENNLELTAISGKDFSGASFGPITANPIAVSWSDTLNPNNTENGILAELTFKIKDNAAIGKTNITLTYDPDNVYNSDWDNVPFSITNGYVDIAAKPVAATNVTINRDKLSLKTGEAETLLATVLPDNATNKTVTWESSDSSVATVSDTGKVTAIKEGTATITVTTVDGSYSASCTVSVACSHANKSETPSKSPDCVNPGNNQYYTCTACGDVFKADGITETTVVAETLPALKHDFSEKNEDAAHLVSGSGVDCQHTKVYYYDCSRCNVIGTATFNSTETGDHQMESTWTTEVGKHFHACGVTGCTYIEDEALCSGSTATCLKKAVCGVCAKEYGQLGDHALTHHAQVEADHTKPGNIEYWTCDVCGKCFADASAKTEIAQKDTVIAQIPHSHGTDWEYSTTQHWNECACGDKINVYNHNYDNACDTTCNTCGYTRTTTHTWETSMSYNSTEHWTECAVCGEKKDVKPHAGSPADCQKQSVCETCKQPYGELAACDFSAKNTDKKYLKTEATCKEAAVYYYSCAVCGKIGTNTFAHGEVDGNNHINTELCGQKEATCDAEGYTGDTWCKDCGKQLTTGTVIRVDHKLSKVEEKAATHEADGVTEHYLCADCGKLFADEKAAKELTAKDIVIPMGEHAYTMQSDASGHWKSCDCGNIVEKAEHTYGEWVITQKAEVGVEGNKERICSVCNYKQTEKIPATSTPVTGDETKLGMLLAALLVSAFGMAAVLFVIPQKKGKYLR